MFYFNSIITPKVGDYVISNGVFVTVTEEMLKLNTGYTVAPGINPYNIGDTVWLLPPLTDHKVKLGTIVKYDKQLDTYDVELQDGNIITSSASDMTDRTAVSLPMKYSGSGPDVVIAYGDTVKHKFDDTIRGQVTEVYAALNRLRLETDERVMTVHFNDVSLVSRLHPVGSEVVVAGCNYATDVQLIFSVCRHIDWNHMTLSDSNNNAYICAPHHRITSINHLPLQSNYR